MQLLNFTGMTAGYTMGMRPDGRTLLVVAVKGTFQIPGSGEEPRLSDVQLPLVDADIYTGEPGFSSTLYESEYAPEKLRCDVLLNGSAYAPNGRPAQRVPVALHVGSMTKTFQVVGPRVWIQGLAAIAPSEPQFFVRMPISYDNAFGGIDATDPDKPRYFALNHAGKGFSHHMNLDMLIGQPLPNTEEIENPITNPRGNYRPMSFGPVGRSWEPRARMAGTYDKDWLDNVCPFLPSDFRSDYYQSAPLDQQIQHLQGGEEVSLLNLTPEGHLNFALPRIEVPVSIRPRGKSVKDCHDLAVVIDTILLEPDFGRFSLVWRCNWPLSQDMFEIDTIVIGKMSKGRRIALETGRAYYRSLGEMLKSRPEVAIE